MYVLACSKHFQTMYILQYRGYIGFQVIQKIPAPGINTATVFTSSNNDLFIAVSSSTGYTRILKAIIENKLF
ncbi:hypothetical protein X975_00490, partial [Stegodyphus mimosarum]